jgi:hypothetical protein
VFSYEDADKVGRHHLLLRKRQKIVELLADAARAPSVLEPRMD